MSIPPNASNQIVGQLKTVMKRLEKNAQTAKSKESSLIETLQKKSSITSIKKGEELKAIKEILGRSK